MVALRSGVRRNADALRLLRILANAATSLKAHYGSVLFAFCWANVAGLAQAGQPELRNLDVRGLQVGGTTTLVLDGDESGLHRLLLPFAAKQVIKSGGNDKRATISVTLGEEVVSGYYHLHVVTEHGITLPVLIGVDRLPQQLQVAAALQLPVAVHGVVSGSAVAETKFHGKAKQKVLVEVEAQRLGSKLRPIVHLYGPKKTQIAWSWTTPWLAGDTRLEAELPEDGTYTVALHDAEYAAPPPGYFRLKIGDWSYVDQVFPPVIARNQGQTVKLLGMTSSARLDLKPASDVGVLPLAWPNDGALSGPRPFVVISPYAEVVEEQAGGQLQDLPEGPVGVSGQLLTPFEEDRYRVPVKPGMKVRLEVLAERYGSPLDVALVVRNEKGDAVARAEDGPGTLDPVLDYTVPDKLTALIVGVVDAQGRGGPRGIYRLTIDPQTSSANRQDYQLWTTAPRITLPLGGRAVFPVLLERRGHRGKVELTATGLPAGVKFEGAVIPEGADGTLVTVSRTDVPLDAVITHWHGHGATGMEQPVVVRGHPLSRLQPWLATEIALAPTTAKAADFQIDWRDLPSDAGLFPGRKLALPLKMTQPGGKTTVKLTLLTSQPPPLANNQPDPNKTLRQEKAVELASNATSGELTVLVPAELAAPAYDVTVQAELLSADKKTVLAIAYAPVRNLAVRVPLLVSLKSAARMEVTLNPKGTTVKIEGKIERREGVKGDVALALTGLPAGAQAAPVTLKADATDFTLNLVLPPNTPAGEVRGLKLSGTVAADPKQPNVRVRSREVELTLVLHAPAK